MAGSSLQRSGDPGSEGSYVWETVLSHLVQVSTLCLEMYQRLKHIIQSMGVISWVSTVLFIP